MNQPVPHMARTILVVDDEPTQREMLAEALEAEGFTIVTAADGRAALLKFRESRPDLVLLDLMLPELSGIEVCRIIRAEIGRADPDADGQGLRARQGRRPGARCRRLRHQAVQPARADRPGPGPVPADRAAGDDGRGAPRLVDLGDVQVDLAGHRLLRDGVTVPLKPKAFELLAFLVRNPGQVFTRDQLLEHVWGYDYAGETRTVDVHVHWLRSRIEADPANPSTCTPSAARATCSAARPDPAAGRRYPWRHAPQPTLLCDPA